MARMGAGVGRNFNPRSPSGLRPMFKCFVAKNLKFQSTQPEWAATTDGTAKFLVTIFQSTQPEWAATGNNYKYTYKNTFQSTQPEWAATVIMKGSAGSGKFQSTQPEWAATP